METMTNELTVIPRTIGMMTRMMDVINTEEIEDAVIVSEEEQEEHPNFIESNTSGITLEELVKKFESEIKKETLTENIVFNTQRDTYTEVSINGEKLMLDVEVVK